MEDYIDYGNFAHISVLCKTERQRFKRKDYEKYCFFECPRANSQSVLTGSLSKVQVKYQVYHSGCDVVLIKPFFFKVNIYMRNYNKKQRAWLETSTSS